jgi:hypothetical protein
MKILNIGFGKSGTLSLTKAFEILGYKSVHCETGEVRLRDVFKNNMKRGARILEGFEEYEFLSDFKGEFFYKELDIQYPNSKFIVTMRDLEGWLASMEKHVERNQKNPNYKYNFLKVEKEKWAEKREEKFTEIKKYFKDRPEDFLIMDIANGDGWEKLCCFLGKPIPAEAFPHKNKTIN